MSNYGWIWFNHQKEEWQAFSKETADIIEKARGEQILIGNSPIEKKGEAFPWIIYFCDGASNNP